VTVLVLAAVSCIAAGLSAGEGTASGDLMDKEVARHGQEGRNRVQLELLEIDETSDAIAGLDSSGW
jgi:hypothetical protein